MYCTFFSEQLQNQLKNKLLDYTCLLITVFRYQIGNLLSLGYSVFTYVDIKSCVKIIRHQEHNYRRLD